MKALTTAVIATILSFSIYAQADETRESAGLEVNSLKREIIPITPEEFVQVDGLLPPTEDIEIDGLTPPTQIEVVGLSPSGE